MSSAAFFTHKTLAPVTTGKTNPGYNSRRVGISVLVLICTTNVETLTVIVLAISCVTIQVRSKNTRITWKCNCSAVLQMCTSMAISHTISMLSAVIGCSWSATE